jgi:hypothetical protein
VCATVRTLEPGAGVWREVVVGYSLRAESVDPKRRAMREVLDRARCGVHRIGSGTISRSVAAESVASRVARGGRTAELESRVGYFRRSRVGRDVQSRAAQGGVFI